MVDKGEGGREGGGETEREKEKEAGRHNPHPYLPSTSLQIVMSKTKQWVNIHLEVNLLRGIHR